MRNVNDNKDNSTNSNKLTNKIMDFNLYQQIDASYHYMRLIEQQIKFCEMQIAYLQKRKPYWFQKKKLKAYYEDIELIEDKICDYYRKINNEVKIIEKIKNNIPKRKK